MEIAIVSALLLISFYLFISERIPPDLTAIGIIIALPALGILSPVESVAGLAHPAVVTVAAMLIISRGMVRTGAVEFIGRRIIGLSGGSPGLSLLIILATVAVASAFINNTPVVVLFIPVVMSMCCAYGLSPSKYLIPVSYASILAGTCTLIGTSTNIIVSDLSAAHGFGELSMFELSAVGVPIAVIGIVFLLLAAPRAMPSLTNPICEIKGPHRRYLAELLIPGDSPLVGKDPTAALPALEVLELIRYTHIYHPGRDDVEIAPDDRILVKGEASDLVALLNQGAVELPPTEKGLSFGIAKDEPVVVELIIPPQSGFIGRKIMETHVARDRDIHLLAIKRSGLQFTERQIREARLRTGDILLVWCSDEKLIEMRAATDYLIIEDIHEEIVHKAKARRALFIFLAMITAATAGVANIMVCALAACFAMIVTGCLQLRDAYAALQGRVLLLIAGTIALGAAMEGTGASRAYAQWLLSPFADAPPFAVLAGVMLLTSLGSQILSNNATAVLLFPIAISIAAQIQVDPKPFIIGVCIGASACFATPIGYQTNLLVYGPGGYRFSDFLKLGIPLNLIVLLTGTILIPMIWPF